MKLSFSTIKGIGLCIIPFALYFVPLNYLNRQHSICLFKNLLGFECWGCGITRAVISTVQFHFTDAFTYNKLVVVVFPLLFYLWLKELIKCFARNKLMRQRIKKSKLADLGQRALRFFENNANE